MLCVFISVRDLLNNVLLILEEVTKLKLTCPRLTSLSLALVGNLLLVAVFIFHMEYYLITKPKMSLLRLVIFFFVLFRESTEEISTWKIINLMRVIGAVVGWVMVAMAPDDDQTAGI